MIDFTSTLGEINDIEHNKGSKIENIPSKVILHCFMSSIPLKHKCLNTILIWVIVSHKKQWSLKKKKDFFFLNWENQTWYWEKKWVFLIGNGAQIRPLEMGKNPLLAKSIFHTMVNMVMTY